MKVTLKPKTGKGRARIVDVYGIENEAIAVKSICDLGGKHLLVVKVPARLAVYVPHLEAAMKNHPLVTSGKAYYLVADDDIKLQVYEVEAGDTAVAEDAFTSAFDPWSLV